MEDRVCKDEFQTAVGNLLAEFDTIRDEFRRSQISRDAYLHRVNTLRQAGQRARQCAPTRSPCRARHQWSSMHSVSVKPSGQLTLSQPACSQSDLKCPHGILTDLLSLGEAPGPVCREKLAGPGACGELTGGSGRASLSSFPPADAALHMRPKIGRPVGAVGHAGESVLTPQLRLNADRLALGAAHRGHWLPLSLSRHTDGIASLRAAASTASLCLDRMSRHTEKVNA